MRVIAKVVLLSITLWIVMSSHAQSVIQNDAIEVTSYELQSQKRVGRFDFEYTYNVTFTNTGETLAGVQGLVISNNPSVTLISGQVDIGDMAANAQFTATIGIQHSRRARFLQSDLEWTFSAEVANQAPTITLVGDNPLFIQVGEQYTDLGANAVDLEDGALSVVIDDSNVDTSEIGEYFVSFNAVDSQGASAETVFRTVFVEQAPIQTTRKIVVHKVGQGQIISSLPNRVSCFDNNICEVLISQGESIDLEAIPDADFSFDGFRSCELTSGDICTLTYDSGRSVIASFVQELVLEDNVVQLNEQQIGFLQNYTQGTNELVFSSFVDSTGFEVGNILVADDYTDFPNDIVVFAERIVDIQTDADGTLRLRVVPATLDDVIKVGSFTQAEIEARIGNSTPSIQSITAVMPSGERLVMTNQQTCLAEPSNIGDNGVLNKAKFTITVFDNNTPEPNDDVCMVLTITLDGSPFLSLGFERFAINEVIFTYNVELEAKVEFIVNVGLKIDEIDAPDFFVANFPCYPATLGICLLPIFTFNPTASFDIGTAITADGTFILNGKGGIHYLDGVTRGIFDIEPGVRSDVGNFSGINARVQGGLEAKFATLLNAFVGPEIGLSSYVALNSDINLSPTCPVNFYTEVGLKATAGGRINFIDIGFEITLAEWKKLFELDEACTSQTPPGRPNIVTLSNNGTNIRLDWEDNDNVFNDRTYSVFRTTPSSRTLVDDGLSANFYIDPIISSSLEYCYIVVVTNTAGLSAESPEECVSFIPPDNTPPSTPFNLQVTSQDSITFTLSWDASFDASTSVSYSLYETNLGTGEIFYISNTSETQIDVTPNRTGETCYFIIASDNDGNLSSSSEIKCVDALLEPIPEPAREIFSDNFDRPDSTDIGNGWTKLIGGSGIELVDGAVRVNVISEDNLPPSGIYRFVDYVGDITLKGKIFETNGFRGLSNRYLAAIGILGGGTPSSGYHVVFTRSDRNFNNSEVQLFDSGTLVQRVPSSFQFGSDITFEVTFREDGAVSGIVSGNTQQFEFDFAPRSVESSGDYIYFEATKPDVRRTSTYRFHGLDEFSVIGVPKEVVLNLDANGKDIWTTSVFSLDGTENNSPGGGRNDEYLRVGGWGDKYHSLIQFNLEGLPLEVSSAEIELYVNTSLDPRFTPVGMLLDVVNEDWDWRESGTGRDRERLWWADRPSTSQ